MDLFCYLVHTFLVWMCIISYTKQIKVADFVCKTNTFVLQTGILKENEKEEKNPMFKWDLAFFKIS